MVTLEKESLLAAIKKVIPGVEKGKSTIEGADQLLFSGKFVHSYNGMVAVSAPCDTQGQEFAVKGLDFFRLVDRMNDLLLSIELVGGKLKVTGGRTKASMSLLDPSKIKTYVAAINVEAVQFNKVPEGFVDGIRITSISGNTTKLKGVAVTDYEDGSAVIATDMKRICLTKLPSPMSTFWVDDGTLSDAFKCGEPLEYSVTGPWLHFKYEDGTVFSAQRKDHAGYPFTTCKNFVNAIPSAEVKMSGRLPQDIKDAVNRVAVLASGTEDNSSLVEMIFHKDELELHAEKQGGEATETIPWDVPPSADPENTQVWVDVAFLTEAANKTVDFSLVSINNQPPSLIFKSDNYTQMVSSNKK